MGFYNSWMSDLLLDKLKKEIWSIYVQEMMNKVKFI